MKRFTITPFDNWQKLVEEGSLSWHTHEDGSTYWAENAGYEFTSDEVDMLEETTQDLIALCSNAIDHVIKSKQLGILGIHQRYHQGIEQSWLNDQPSLHGRFDFAYDGINPPKLLEINGDTPTTLIETAVAQWLWKERYFPYKDQFNSLEDKLVDRFRFLKNAYRNFPVIHFVSMDTEEDIGTVSYLQYLAGQAGWRTERLLMSQIGHNAVASRFVDMQNQPINLMYKLYPWEWLLSDAFGELIPNSSISFIEPIWKCILSNKIFLKILWDMYPNHKNLLETDTKPLGNPKYLSKPALGREGANITTYGLDHNYQTKGTYSDNNFVYQEIAPLFEQDGNYAILGSWFVNNLAAGMGVREDSTMIVTNKSRFVPHIFQ